MRKLGLVGLFLVVGAGVVVAAEAAAAVAGTPPKLFSQEFWKVVGTGVLSGLFASVVGYLKNKPIGSWDWQYASTSLVIGALIGGVAGYKGIQFADAQTWLESLPVWAGLTTLVDMGVKALWRHIGSGLVKKGLGTETTPPANPQ